jgi:protein tyrosine phosphatase
MLTNFVESQKRKADQYWPKTLDESLKYGDFEVVPLSHSMLIIRLLSLKRRPLSRVMAEKVQCQLLRLTKQGKNSQYTAYIVRKFCLRNLSPSPSTTVKETKSELTSKRAEKKALPSSRSETDTASSKAPFGSRTDVPPQKKKRPHREKEVAETRRTPRTGRERSKSDAERHPDVNEDKGKEKLDPPTKANSEIKGRRKPKGGKGKDKEEKQDTAKLEERIVYHYHYCSWPDMDVPSNGNDLIEMMQAATQLENGEDHTGETGEGAHDEESVAPPTVVHCSAGIGTNFQVTAVIFAGRAGTYILIHTALAYALENKMEDYSTVPVKEVVLKLRQQRCGMIQTKVCCNIVSSYSIRSSIFLVLL